MKQSRKDCAEELELLAGMNMKGIVRRAVEAAMADPDIQRYAKWAWRRWWLKVRDMMLHDVEMHMAEINYKQTHPKRKVQLRLVVSDDKEPGT